VAKGGFSGKDNPLSFEELYPEVSNFFEESGVDRGRAVLNVIYANWPRILEITMDAPDHRTIMTRLVTEFGLRQLDVHFILSLPLWYLTAEYREVLKAIDDAIQTPRSSKTE